MTAPARVLVLGLSDHETSLVKRGLEQEFQLRSFQSVSGLTDFNNALSQFSWDLIFAKGLPDEFSIDFLSQIPTGGQVVVVLDSPTTNDFLRYQNAGAVRILPSSQLEEYLPACIQFLKKIISCSVEDDRMFQEVQLDFIKQTPDLVAICDFNGFFLYLNPAAQKYGDVYDPAEIRKIHVSSMYRPEIWNELNGYIRQMTIREGTWSGQLEIINRYGQAYLVSQVLCTYRNPQGAVVGFITVVRILRSNDMLVDEFKDQRNRLALIINSSPITVYSVLAEPPYSITFITPNVELLTGYQPEEIIEAERFAGSEKNGERLSISFWKDQIHPEDIQRVNQNFLDSLKAGSGEIDYRFRKKNGEYRWFHEEMRVATDATGKIHEIFGYLSDITHQTLSEEALKKSEDLYRLLAEASHDLIYVISPDDQIVYINSHACQVLGMSQAEAIGLPRNRFFPDPENELQHSHIREVFQKKQILYSEIFVNLPKKSAWLGTWIIPILDSSGEVTAVMGVSRDISDRKHAIKELEEAYSKEKELNRLRNDFINIVSHEFRTPLSAILSSAELLEHYGDGWSHEKCLQHIQRIEEAVGRLTELLNDLFSIRNMDQASAPQSAPKTVQIIEFCQKLIDSLSITDHRQHFFFLKSTLNVQHVTVDQQKLRTVLENVFINALKYSPPGSTIQVQLALENSHLVILVTDEGFGISEKDFSMIFEPFFRGENTSATPGTGLGLTIVRKILDNMGGNIHLQSEPGHGTTVTIEIPVEDQQAGTTNPREMGEVIE
jgi:PAS domain S-box-containing protein